MQEVSYRSGGKGSACRGRVPEDANKGVITGFSAGGVPDSRGNETPSKANASSYAFMWVLRSM